jgi:hypothetical protein
LSQNYVIGPTGPVGSRNGAGIVTPNRKHPAFTIFNTGKTTVFLDDEDPLGDPSSGLPLTPGSSIPWDADKALYATCPTKGYLTTTGNSGVPFDAGAVAAQILDQGLATDIASAIYVTGSPPVDKFTQILDTNTISGNYTTPAIDASSYASLCIHISNGFPTRMVPGHFTVWWYSSGADPAYPTQKVIAVDEFYIGTGVSTEVRLPVRGALAYIQVQSTSGSCSFEIYGSYKATDRLTYLGEGYGSNNGAIDGTGHAGVQTWNGVIPVGSTWIWQPDTSSGPARLILRYNSTSTVTMVLRAVQANLPLTIYAGFSNVGIAPAQTDTYELLLPPMPLELSLACTSASANPVTFRATLVPQIPYV